MKKAHVCHQERWWCSGRSYFTILNSLLLIFLCSGQALAAQTCKPTSITASTPTADFVVNSNGTVTDKKTGLMWKVCSEGQTWSAGACTGGAATYTWQAALQQAQTVNAGAGFAGFTDWRVPNEKELDSIVEVQCVTPSINATIFPAAPPNYYWSASPYAGTATDAWYVLFSNGNDNFNLKSKAASVRLVRAGQ